MPATDFCRSLEVLGYAVEQRAPGYVLDYEVPLGPHRGRTLRLGFQVGDDWPLNPPSGPHVRPHLLSPASRGNQHPNGGVHASAFGPDWQYWSRPFWLGRGWADTDRSVRTYMKFIDNLFATL